MALLCKQAVYDSKLITDEIVEEFYQMAKLPGAAEATLNLGRSNFNIWGQFYQPIAKRLQTIAAPTLIIWGRQDPMVPVIHAQNAAKIIPNTCSRSAANSRLALISSSVNSGKSSNISP